MTDKQFDRIKKGLKFYSENGVNNLCTLTETSLRGIIEFAIKDQTEELKALRESIKDYGAGCYENGLSNGRRKLEAQIDKMKRCEICKHYQGESCNYHSNWVKDCKENGMKLFELKEIKEK